MNDNKLIAEFMGYRLFGTNSRAMCRKPDLEYNLNEDLAPMQFDKSWDWLMPVVEKCLEKHNNLIDGRDVIDTSYSSIAQALQVVSLKETYKAVVEFIKAYSDDTI